MYDSREMKKLKGVLYKKAVGYERNDVQEEYAVDDLGNETLVRRKVQRKYYPPDLTAMKAYIEMKGERKLEELSDAELQKEKIRLLKELKDTDAEEKDGG